MIDRFGVVNVVTRENYEKKWNLPYGHKFISFNKVEAIAECRKLNNSFYIVERIFDSPNEINMKQEIYRSGNEKKY